MIGHAGSHIRIVHVNDLDPIQGQGHGASKVPTIAENCFSRSISSAILAWSIGAQNSWLVMIVRDLDYSLSEADFGVSFYESYRVSSNVAECR